MEKILLNATDIAERIGMNKNKVLTLIKDGTLPVCKEKEIRFQGRYVTVRYVNKEEIDKFIYSDIYINYMKKKKTREENRLKREKEKKEKNIMEFKKIIESYGGITEELIGKVIYSYSKRAKYYNLNGYYHEKNVMYSKKDNLLNLYKPLEAHINKRHIRYYDFPKSHYVDVWERDAYLIEKDVLDVLEFYKVGNYSFHKPIGRIDDMSEIDNISLGNLNIKKIELNSKIITNLDELLDVNLCDYIYEKLIEENKLIKPKEMIL